MGLFDKKTCAICGSQTGAILGLFGSELAGGEYLCPDCRKKCTPNPNLKFSKMTLDEVKADMAVAAANRQKGTSEFHSTLKIKNGAYRDRSFLDLDENHGWFMNTALNDGWVYSLDDIYFYTIELTTEKLAEGQTFYADTSRYPELPKCPDGCRITGASLKILLLENELGIDSLNLNLLTQSGDEKEVRGAYACVHDFVEAMKEYRTAHRK